MKEGLLGYLIQAHPDDRAHSGGVDSALVSARTRLRYVTFTDGAARDLPLFLNKQILKRIRAAEDRASIDFIGGEKLDVFELPDANLARYQYLAVELLKPIIQKNKPNFLITPHILDPHEDHVAAAEIALAVADDEIPVYFMDTATGKDRNGERIRHTHYVRLTRNQVRKGKKAFRLHASQTRDLPQGEIQNVFAVMGMPKYTATVLNIPEVVYASGLTLVDFSMGDPLTEVLGKEKIIFDEELLSV